MDDLPPESPIGDSNTPESPTGDSNIEKPLEIKEYEIKYNLDNIKILIIKNKSSIKIKCSDYEKSLTSNELSLLMQDEKYKSIDISFDFFKKEFNKNNVKITKIQPQKMLLIITDDNGKKIQIELFSNKGSYTPTPDGNSQIYSEEIKNQYIEQNKKLSQGKDLNETTPDIYSKNINPNFDPNMGSAPNIIIENIYNYSKNLNKQYKDFNSFSKNYLIQKDYLVNEFYKLSIVFDNTKKENFIMKEYKENFIKLFEESEKFYLMEILNMKRCNNKYIIKSLDDFIQDNKIILIIEYIDCTLKQLFDEKKSFKIDEIKKLLIKLNEGIKHLDKNRINNIIIMPENIGIIKNEKTKTYSLKLIDLFPYYEIKDDLKKMNYTSKIFKYMSPEIPFLYNTPDDLQKENDNTLNTHSKSILWNIGLLMYELFFGELPKMEETSDKNLILDINKLKKSGDNLFDELISELLTKDFQNRIDWDNYVNHKFFLDIPIKDVCEILYEKKINENTQELDIISEEIDENNLKKIFKINFNGLLNLDLSNNSIKDISIFNQKQLQNLKILNFKNNKIKDLKEVNKFSFKNLEFLFLSSNKISNLKSFQYKNFDNLCYLSLSKNNINDISPLNEVNLLNLNILNLSFNNINDISILSKMNIPYLKELYLNNNNIKELYGLLNTNFKELEKLDLESNQIEDINIFEQVNFQQKLKELNLAKNPIVYYENLNLCYFQSLEKIYFNSNDPKFQIISLKLKLYGYEFEKSEEDLTNNVSVLFIAEGISKFDISNLTYKDSFKIITNRKVHIPNLQKFFIEKVLEMDLELVDKNKALKIRENTEYETTKNINLDNYTIYFYSFTENIEETQIKTNNFYLISLIKINYFMKIYLNLYTSYKTFYKPSIMS